jgi:hypothetical protein
LARSQHGIVTRRQLVDAGLSADTVDRWIKAGRLIAVHRGVYAVGHLPVSPHAAAMAAVLACGPRAVLSHRSAAHLWGLIRHHGPIEITAPSNHRHRAVTLHRSRLRDHEITMHYGIPTTTPARTLTDLAHILTPASLTRAVNDARLRHLLSDGDLPAKPTHAPTRSVLEDTFLAFLDAHDLPRPEVNATVAGYEVDMLWRPQRLIAELDGRAYHADFEQDRDRDAGLLTAGFRVIRITWDRLTNREPREAARFTTLLA